MKRTGPLRLLADEVERTMVPQLLAIGLCPDPEFREQGKWNKVGYQWRFLFPAPSDGKFALLVRISSKKSTIFDASLLTLAHPTLGEVPRATADAPPFEDLPSIGVFGLPLSAISEFLFLEWLDLGWLVHDWADRILLRIIVIPLALLWFVLASLILLLSVPILGYRHRGERSKAVASGDRQRRMVARATAVLSRTFRDGVPQMLTRRLVRT